MQDNQETEQDNTQSSSNQDEPAVLQIKVADEFNIGESFGQ